MKENDYDYGYYEGKQLCTSIIIMFCFPFFIKYIRFRCNANSTYNVKVLSVELCHWRGMSGVVSVE